MVSSHISKILQMYQCRWEYSPAVQVNFWAVQYHPEFDFHEIAGLAHGRRDALIAQGIFHDHDQAGQFVNEMRALDTAPLRTDLAWKYGADDDVMDPGVKTREVQNWLDYFFND